MEKNVSGEPRINWNAVQAVGVILTLAVTWWIGRHQAQTQMSALTMQLQSERTERSHELRRQRRPILAFECMTYTVPVDVSEVAGVRFDLPRDEHGVVLPGLLLPQVKNYGSGPAIDMGVSYDNETPAPSRSVTVPLHCLPGESSGFYAIPNRINDAANPVDFFEGIARIVCKDTAGDRHFVEQKYTVSVRDSRLIFNFQEVQGVYWLSPLNSVFGLREDY